MHKHQHLFNAILGGYLLWLSVKMIIPALLEIQGWVSILTDEAISNPHEIIDVYFRSGAPIMILMLLLAGCLGICAFVQCQKGAFIKLVAVLSAMGYACPVVVTFLGQGSAIQILSSARYLWRPILLFVCGEWWKRYLNQADEKGMYRNKKFPYWHELKLWLGSRLD